MFLKQSFVTRKHLKHSIIFVITFWHCFIFKLCQKFKVNDLGPSGVLRGCATVVSWEKGAGGARREVS